MRYKVAATYSIPNLGIRVILTVGSMTFIPHKQIKVIPSLVYRLSLIIISVFRNLMNVFQLQKQNNETAVQIVSCSYILRCL